MRESLVAPQTPSRLLPDSPPPPSTHTLPPPQTRLLPPPLPFTPRPRLSHKPSYATRSHDAKTALLKYRRVPKRSTGRLHALMPSAPAPQSPTSLLDLPYISKTPPRSLRPPMTDKRYGEDRGLKIGCPLPWTATTTSILTSKESLPCPKRQVSCFVIPVTINNLDFP